MTRKLLCLTTAAAISLGGIAGCSQMEENKQTSGTAIGGVAGAAAGALIGGEDDRLIGALIGGALGAGGGYLVGTQLEKADEDDREDAIKANESAQKNPATAQQAKTATTADVNGDGYVTLDEIVAMDKAGLSDNEIISRLDRTDMFFDLSEKQRQYLRDNGVSDRVVTEMNTVNADIKRQAEERARERSSTGGQSVGKT